MLLVLWQMFKYPAYIRYVVIITPLTQRLGNLFCEGPGSRYFDFGSKVSVAGTQLSHLSAKQSDNM